MIFIYILFYFQKKKKPCITQTESSHDKGIYYLARMPGYRSNNNKKQQTRFNQRRQTHSRIGGNADRVFSVTLRCVLHGGMVVCATIGDRNHLSPGTRRQIDCLHSRRRQRRLRFLEFFVVRSRASQPLGGHGLDVSSSTHTQTHVQETR